MPHCYCRNGANPGFHEAIGDTIAKSVSTPAHLKSIGLLPNYTYSANQDLNYLYKQALEKVAFLPWAYLMDLWRWEVFNGTYTPANWNQNWWKLRTQLQGLSIPPGSGARTSSNFFDPASKSHTDDNTPYIRYFVSFIVQFQFYQSMCNAAGYNSTALPLHSCDFANSTAAGNVLGQMLSLGSSKPWQQAMQQITNQTQMSAQALKTYFQPLTTWLSNYNHHNCDCYGWGAAYPSNVLSTLATPRCPPPGTPFVNKEPRCQHHTKAASTAVLSSALALFAALLVFLRA